jgi:cellulase/cellobiase CelA1
MSNTLEIYVTSTQNWGGAGNGNIKITNITKNPITNWKFNLTTTNYTITSMWNFTTVASGNNLVISSPSWNNKSRPKCRIRIFIYRYY